VLAKKRTADQFFNALINAFQNSNSTDLLESLKTTDGHSINALFTAGNLLPEDRYDALSDALQNLADDELGRKRRVFFMIDEHNEFFRPKNASTRDWLDAFGRATEVSHVRHCTHYFTSPLTRSVLQSNWFTVLCGSSHSNFLVNINRPLNQLKVIMKGFNCEETRKLLEVLE